MRRLLALGVALSALVAAECGAAGMKFGEAVPGAVATAAGDDGDAVVICIEPGSWVGKTQAGYAVISANIGGWS